MTVPADVYPIRRADALVRRRADRGCLDPCQVCSSSNCVWLACAEGDDAPDRIVRRDANGHTIARDYLDAEAAHAPAELGQHLMSCVALHAVKPPAVHRDHGALHINEIILAQLLARPFLKQTLCHKDVPAHNETLGQIDAVLRFTAL